MEINDTLTGLFTRVPRQVERTWSIQEVPISALTGSDDGPIETSLIESVTLIIKYRDMAAIEEEILDEKSDSSNTRLAVWKSAQNLYRDLAGMVSARLRELSEATLTSAKEHKASKVELVKVTRTAIHKRSRENTPVLSSDEFRNRVKREVSPEDSTVHPNDSASSLSASPTSAKRNSPSIFTFGYGQSKPKGSRRGSRNSS
jgi:hypothetical protein